MKTGRVRKKKVKPSPPPTPKTDEQKPDKEAKPRPQAVATSGKPYRSPKWIFAILVALFVCCAAVMIALTLHGGPQDWVPVTRADGTWMTTVVVLAPQVQPREMWEADCLNTPDATLRTETCVLKDADTYQDRVVDDYEEYAYDIYYEETTDQVYEARGTDFVATTLGSDDWWEGNKHYIRTEELDKGSCSYTNYTVWIDDPQDATQEIEVYLSQCEVWDHVVVKERVYDQKRWCVCDVTTLVQVSSQSEQGTGLNVRWPQPDVPAGGRTERSFKGQVTFTGGDYVYTATTDDPALYQDYLTGRYYIGIRDGKPVTVSKNPKK